jgi:hypothetical protein
MELKKNQEDGADTGAGIESVEAPPAETPAEVPAEEPPTV